MANLANVWENSFNHEWGVSEFHSRTVRGKNENLYASVEVVIAVKVVPSEEGVTLVDCLSLSTEIATLPHTALPNSIMSDVS